MASNSSAAAFFGVRDGDQQDQIKPLISPQQQLAAALPGVAGAVPAASGQGAPTAAAPQPPPKKKRTMPGNSRNPSTPPFWFQSCMHTAYTGRSGLCCLLRLREISLARLDRLEFYELDAGSRSIFFSHMHSIGFSFHFFVVSCLCVSLVIVSWFVITAVCTA